MKTICQNITADGSAASDDKPKANCGVIGIWGLEEASTLSYLGLYALQHRGQEAAGIVSSDGDHLYRHAGMGLVADLFKRKEIFTQLAGKAAIGHNRYSTTGMSTGDNVQPLLVKDRSGLIAMAHNGNLVNYKKLQKFLEDEGSIFRTSSDSELILQLLARSHGDSLSDRLTEALRMVLGAYSLVLLRKDQLIAARDPLGFRPLCIGKLGEGWVVASESCSLDLMGAEYVSDVEPGEMVIISDDGMERIQFDTSEKKAHCIFEFVYFSRPDSRVFRDNVDKTRRYLGHVLAKHHPAPGADMVMSVPDSSNTAALGYAHYSDIPFEIALIRNHYVGRTFIEPEQGMRDFGVKVKFNAVSGVLKGKKVVLVDDSIVRGTTIKKLVRMIRHAGAIEVHVRISSPPIISPCFYGMNFPTRRELIVNKFDGDIEAIRRTIEADTLEYLTAEELVNAVPHSNGQGYCTACFTGIYPISIDDDNRPIKVRHKQ